MEQNSNSNNESNQDTLVNSDKQKKPLITFAKINKYFIIPFLTPVFCMLANYFIAFVRNSNVIKHEEFALSIFILLSYIASGCFYFIPKFRQKVEGAKDHIIYKERATTAIKYIYNEASKKSLLKKCILIIVIGFLITLFELLSIFSHGHNLFQERLYFLIFIPLFSKWILKENFFRHHYFSLLIAIGGIILLILPTCFEFKVSDIIPNVMHLIGAVGYSLFLVIIKYLTHVHYISPFKLSLIFGFISIGFIFFAFLIYTLIKYHDFTYFIESVDFSNVENKLLVILYFILTFIFATALQFFTLLVIFYFSPILLMVTDIISPMLLWAALQIRNPGELPDIVLNPVGFSIVLFASLIYNEIIIFNFCGLNKDTKKFIEERLNEESKEIRKTENDLKLGTLDRTNDDTIEEDRNSQSQDRNSNSS